MAFLNSDTDNTQRVLPIAVLDANTRELTNALITSANVQLLTWGGAWVNATNNPTQLLGVNGAWELQLNADEENVNGLLGWRVVGAGLLTEVSWMTVSPSVRFPDYVLNQLDATQRVLPIFVVDKNTGLPSNAVISRTDILLHLHGASGWVNPINTPVSVPGQVGAWTLQLEKSEVGAAGPLGCYVINASVRTQLFFVQVGTISTSAVVSGSVLSVSGASNRFDPVVAKLIADPSSLLIRYKTGVHRLFIYDLVEGFSPLFNERSLIMDLGGGQILATILPNGGWWAQAFELKFLTGSELT